MSSQFIPVFLVIGVAFIFDFLNGLHDAANSIATIISTRVLKPQWAVFWAAFFNLIAFVFFDLHVANTIGNGLIESSAASTELILSALLGAIIWNLITWYYGLPSSSSHALIGGLVGAAICQSGFGVLNLKILLKVFISIFLSPFFGLMAGLILMFLVARLFFNSTPYRVNAIFRKMQFFSAALISLGHGGNDAQKTMGIITILLFSSGLIERFQVPFWVMVSCSGVMAFGTLFGGWKIVKTMGMKITRLKPIHGFCAESAAALTLFTATSIGIPVSTTHTITGSIMGVGTINGLSAVRWGVAGRIMWAWVITIPSAAIISAALRYIIHMMGFGF